MLHYGPEFFIIIIYSFPSAIPKECHVVKSSSHWIVIVSSVSIVCAAVVATVANIQCKYRYLCILYCVGALDPPESN